MTQRTRKTIGILALALLVGPALVWGARATLRSPLAGGGAMVQRMVQKLQLTPDQIAAIKQILKSHQAELQSEIQAVVKAREGLFDAIHADTSSESAIRSAASVAGQAESDLAVTRGTIVQEIRGVLTPEQQAEAKQLLADFKAHIEDLVAIVQSRLQGFLN